MAKLRAPSFVLLSGDRDGGDRVVGMGGAERRARWTRMAHSIAAFSLLEEEEGDGEELQEATKIGDEGQDIARDGRIEVVERSSFVWSGERRQGKMGDFYGWSDVSLYFWLSSCGGVGMHEFR